MARMSEREPKWMSLSLAAKFEDMAREQGVSKVARSSRGFFPQYKKAKGHPDRLDPWWRNRRNNFVTRHMAQVKAHGESLVTDDGSPTRRHLALIMWAYSPMSEERLKKMLRDYNENPSRFSEEDIRLLGEAYLKGQDISGTPRAQEMARAQADRVRREFEKLTKRVNVEFTERDPYTSFEELQADVLGNKHMWVFTGFSDTPLWSPQVNWMSRAVHDMDHVLANTDFSMEGELTAFQVAAARAPELAPLYLSEIALQAASFHVLGGQFAEGPQKLVFADEPVMRAASQFRRNASANEEVVGVWDAAGALRYMTPEQMMTLLATKGVSYEDALIMVLAAMQIDLGE
jgi:hypothetical protein